MSEKPVKSSKPTPSSKSNEAPAAKSEPTSSSESSEASAAKSEPTSSSESSEASAAKPSSERGKSSKESAGGTSAVHYGFFSNIKTPEYRSGWDGIWAKKDKPVTARTHKIKKPLTVEIAFNKLPPFIQEALADAVRVEMKKSRMSYDNRVKKGEISWHLYCEVKR